MVAPKSYKNNLGILIKNKREELGCSRRELAKMVGLPSHDTIRRLELGDYIQYPERETLERIANNLFQIDLMDLEQLLNPVVLNQTLSFDALLLGCENLSEIDELVRVINVCTRCIQTLAKKK